MQSSHELLTATSQHHARACRPFGRSGLARLLGCSVLGTISLAGWLATANAQTGPANNGGDTLQEVVVTAQKTEQDLQKVPLSISVLSGEQLQDEHVTDYQDITREIPGLAFNAGNTVSGGTVGPGTSNIVIRGVSSASGSATVGLYIDDVSITESNLYDGAAEPKFVDFDRVEVLRGPQGTLFGSSSMGGTMRFISKQPVFDQFSADDQSDISGTAHGGVNYVETLDVNVPIVSDKLALRVAGQIGGNSGFINHYDANGDGALQIQGTNTENWDVVHATLKYQPNQDLTISAALFAQGDYTGDTPVFYPQLGTYNQDKPVREPSHDGVFVPSLTINQKFDNFDLTAITGYFYRDFKFTSDGTVFNDLTLAQFVLDPAFPAQAAEDDAIIGTLPSYVHRENATDQISQEVRLGSQTASLFGKPLTWLAGVYVESQRQIHNDYQTSPGLQADFQQIYGFSIYNPMSPTSPANYPAIDNVGYANDLIYFDYQHFRQNQYAAFGQIEYAFLPNLRAAFGFRQLYATLDYLRDSGGFYAAGTTLNPFSVSSHTQASTPKFSLTYDIAPTSNVYLTAAKGFRLGGPTGPVTSALCTQELQQSFGIATPPFAYTPDHLWSYELGSKNLFLNNRVMVNADVFYVNWTNIQQSVNLPICGASITLNVGAAATYGGELEVRAKIVGGLSATFVGGVTRAYITASPNDQTAFPGQWLLNVPAWSATPAFEYDWPLANGNGFVRSDFDLVGDARGSFSLTDPAYDQPGYGVLNASIGIRHDSFTVGLYAKNLADSSKIITRPSINFVEEAYTLRPLTAGIYATIKL